MKTVRDLFEAQPKPAAFATAYISHLAECLAATDSSKIAALVSEFIAARDENSTVFVAGNGGSAATASHMVNDIASDVARKAKLSDPFRVMSLTDNVALISAIANDTGFENIFLTQLQSAFRPGDRFLAISASGNSENLVRAAQWVRERGGRVLSLVGFDGGKLKEISDLTVHVPTAMGEYGIVEDAHLILNHAISNWLICEFGSRSAASPQ